MIVKDVSLGDEARQGLIQGINIIADAVKTTLGARGRTVVIESNEHIGGLTVTKDGVTVANSITLQDAIQNMAVMMMKQAASKTAGEAGDGTTTAIVLAQAIIHQAEKHLKDGMNVTEVLRTMQASIDDIVKLLDNMSQEVSDKMLV
jgi:chaperonin GroEL